MIYQSKSKARTAADMMKNYAQPQRLMILSFLAHGEKTVGEIDEATQIGQPALSQQLAELRHANLIANRREAKSVYYTLMNKRVLDCIKQIERLFAEVYDVKAEPPSLRKIKSSNPNKNSVRQETVVVSTGAATFAKVF
ncbi:MAG: helix-turn-helix transcriptional regulator [Alphaproteobacteria bacterium]|nr:helix-turn-helix transcriptional regulator [Alphaproteobacteria bacterium]